ncbi:hypothetical protein SISSUDRAFT_1046523 [Sistotremastrum suecicum HHB10207 ss-3]|uniref:Uncharacterized protein n=1 Tax=Sistotremastrum suecicum HHB10207 ss-3 TaxID=1314776 RepID=A0A166DPW7_9AGAM|nr:hypothetical protein SISSUDRAFT_1046523 [Sistotremastrum suecicum HHB10207 ss-3]
MAEGEAMSTGTKLWKPFRKRIRSRENRKTGSNARVSRIQGPSMLCLKVALLMKQGIE